MPEFDEQLLAKRIGQTIATFRQARKLTQEDVAERLGIGNEAVSRIERGIVMPTVVRLMEFADIFDCQTADLLRQTSTRITDQSYHVTQLLAKLSSADRTLVVGIVEQISARLEPMRRSRGGVR